MFAYFIGAMMTLFGGLLYALMAILSRPNLIYVSHIPPRLQRQSVELFRDPFLRARLSSAASKLANIFNYGNIAEKLLRSVKM